MIVTVEISLYPLARDYKTHVIAFIRKLNDYDDIKVLTNAMSTYLQGDLSVVMHILSKELEDVYQYIEVSSTVIKVINKRLKMESGYLDFH